QLFIVIELNKLVQCRTNIHIMLPFSAVRNVNPEPYLKSRGLYRFDPDQRKSGFLGAVKPW
ncbi:hypothetical protein, partial [Idiomarina abyssalis]|uniref:hypothetical protein n=1 Tax=Idiomarina abyssalis TaxID=86102 RepID=UPI00241F8754